eukprot:23514-Pelagococcus_subviridis.AAC.1
MVYCILYLRSLLLTLARRYLIFDASSAVLSRGRDLASSRRVFSSRHVARCLPAYSRLPFPSSL